MSGTLKKYGYDAMAEKPRVEVKDRNRGLKSVTERNAAEGGVNPFLAPQHQRWFPEIDASHPIIQSRHHSMQAGSRQAAQIPPSRR